MSMRVIGFVVLLLMATSLCFGQATKAQVVPQRADYQAQIQQLSTSVQAQIQALEAQIAAAQPQDREALQRQIADTKKEGEISRLEILLQWAREKGDAARVTEIQQAIENWRSPPQPEAQSLITKDPATKAAEVNASKPASK